MFDFFKKKNPLDPKVKEQESVLSEKERIEIRSEIKRIQAEIEKQESEQETDHESLAGKYEILGLRFAKLGESDPAIRALEKSLEHKKTIGDGYKKLMSLYNQKRAEAARNGDDEGIEKWMNKMDDMRKIAKKVTISGQ